MCVDKDDSLEQLRARAEAAEKRAGEAEDKLKAIQERSGADDHGRADLPEGHPMANLFAAAEQKDLREVAEAAREWLLSWWRAIRNQAALCGIERDRADAAEANDRLRKQGILTLFDAVRHATQPMGGKQVAVVALCLQRLSGPTVSLQLIEQNDEDLLAVGLDSMPDIPDAAGAPGRR